MNSPCVRNCCLDDNDICLGCFRSLEEIRRWGLISDQEKQDILQLCENRRSGKNEDSSASRVSAQSNNHTL